MLSNIIVLIQEITCLKNTAAKNSSLGSIMGSFVVEIISVSDCDLPKSAYHPSTRITYNVQTYRLNRKSQRLRANFTVNMDFENLTGGILGKFKVNNGYTKMYELSNVSCHHFMMEAFTNIAKLSVSPKCTVAAGEYSFDNFDINGLVHMIVSTFRYGQYSMEMEWMNTDGIILCIKVIIVSKPDSSFKESSS